MSTNAVSGHSIFFLSDFQTSRNLNKASQAIQSPRTVPFFLLVSLLNGY